MPLLGGILPPLRELKSNRENIVHLKILCTLVRNFKNTSLRKAIERMPKVSKELLSHFTIVWATLKVTQILEPSTRSLCYILLRNMWNVEFQMFYKHALERFSQSMRFTRKSSGRLGGPAAPFYPEEYEIRYSELEISVIRCLYYLEPEMWIPLTVFPRLEFESTAKMDLAFEKLDLNDTILSKFRQIIISFMKSLNLDSIYIPPPDLILKVTSARYNDSGTVRRDFELPQKSLNSGFLYQKFNPKPLQPREVWLPDKATKINNQFWMMIGRQILKAVPYYPDDDPEVTHEAIKSKLVWAFGYFDLPGYGFQYPREYLVIIAEVISRLYSNPDIFEFTNIFRRICSSVKVEMPDGTFKFPPRGIGLGYYEDLKTIGIMALLHHIDIKPISVYGDQGLVNPGDERKVLKVLNEFQFVMDKTRIDSKTVVKWSGMTMTQKSSERIRETLDPIMSAFKAQYHWERKNILRSFSIERPDIYKKWDKYIPFLYETLFGWEFHKGDSLLNFSNGGLSMLHPVTTGNLRSWAVERLTTPRDKIVDDFIYETPFYTEWKRSEAKAFSIMRKNIYKNSSKGSTLIRDYAKPVYYLNRNRKPMLPYLARCISDSAESKMIVHYKQTTGKFTSGLRGDDVHLALQRCSTARNPFEAYSTGGIRYGTVWRATARVCPDWLFIGDLLSSSYDLVSASRVQRYDSVNPPMSANMLRNDRNLKRSLLDFDINKVVPTPLEQSESKRPLIRVTLDQLKVAVSHENTQTTEFQPITNLVEDIVSREFQETEEDHGEYDDLVDGYLEYLEGDPEDSSSEEE